MKKEKETTEDNKLQQLIDSIKVLTEKVDNLPEELKNYMLPPQHPNDMYNSIETGEIATALSKAQSKYKSVEYNRENPYFKSSYADLDAILRHVRPILASNGISFYQFTKLSTDGPTVLHTRILHSSGQWIETRSRIIPPKNDQQSYGSTLSYQKRYAAMTLLGITASNDRYDDDGEIATHPFREAEDKGTGLSTRYNPKIESCEIISKEQIEELEYELAEYPDIAEKLLDRFGWQTLSEIPKSKYHPVMNQIRKIKNARNGIK